MGVSPDGLVAAGGDLASTVVSGLFGQHSAKKAMDFEERMANTAYQRAANDLQKAGLNRVLALGSPAMTPGGVSASMPDAHAGSSYQAGASASAVRRVNEETARLLQEQQRKTHFEGDAAAEQAANIRADTALKTGNTSLIPLTAKEIGQRTKTYQPGIELTREQTAQTRALARKTAAEADTEQVKRAGWTAAAPFIDWLIKSIPKPESGSSAKGIYEWMKESFSHNFE